MNLDSATATEATLWQWQGMARALAHTFAQRHLQDEAEVLILEELWLASLRPRGVDAPGALALRWIRTAHNRQRRREARLRLVDPAVIDQRPRLEDVLQACGSTTEVRRAARGKRQKQVIEAVLDLGLSLADLAEREGLKVAYVNHVAVVLARRILARRARANRGAGKKSKIVSAI